jgi:indole-3-acetate monooxygenase
MTDGYGPCLIVSENMVPISNIAVLAGSASKAHNINDAFADLLIQIRERATEFEKQGYISQDIIDGLKHVGFYRSAVARRFGGDERSPREILEMVERISNADGATGWVASFAPQSAVYLGAFPEHILRQVYAKGPDTVVAGGLFPIQPVSVVEGGFNVSGRWSYGSGCRAADWLCVGIAVPSEIADSPHKVMMAAFPADQVEIVANWDVLGLRGTGSDDLVVSDAFLGTEWATVRGGPALIEDRIYHYPALCFAAANHSVVGLGIARAAIDDMIAIAIAKQSITGAPRPADRSYVQLGLASADTKLRAARAFFYEQVDQIWAAVERGETPTIEQRAIARSACTNAARTSAEVVQMVFTLAGTTATKMAHPLQRWLRDVMMVTQHAFVSEGNIENAGRVMLGLNPFPGFP